MARRFFLLKANLGISATTIAKLSQPMAGYNKEVIASLSKQSAYTKIGLALLIFAFILQINLVWPLRHKDFGMSWHGVFMALGICLVLLILADYCSHHLAKRYQEMSLEVAKSALKETKTPASHDTNVEKETEKRYSR